MFTVIIPLYNKAPYIEKAIQSVLTQTYQQFELIVIDDGSNDNPLPPKHGEIDERLYFIENIASHKGKIQIYEQENLGVSVTRNNGVKLAKYDWIAFLDADDWWAPTFLEEMKALIDEFPDAGMYGCGLYSVKNNKNRLINLGVENSFEKGIANYSILLALGNTRPVCTGSCVISKNVFLLTGGFNPTLKLGEDFDLFYRCYLKSGLILLNKPLFYYNQDVDPQYRAISKILYPKEHSVFFNLNYPEQYFDKDVKHLIEFLKLRSYHAYYLAGMYTEEISLDLKKINFNEHLIKFIFQYKVIPIWVQVFWRFTKKCIYKLKIYIKNEKY